MAVPTPGKGGNERGFNASVMADINITPMVDVMLVLLVIFMVTAPLLVAGVRVDLPKNAAPRISHVQKPVVVTLAADGALYLGDGRIDLTSLEVRLAELRAKEGDALVYVRADRRIAYGDVLELLGQVANSGYQRISLLSQATSASAQSPLAKSGAPE